MLEFRQRLDSLENICHPGQSQSSLSGRSSSKVSSPGAGTVSKSALSDSSKRPSEPLPNRKFNILLYGIKEFAMGTPRHVRFANDAKVVTSVLKTVLPSISELSVRDCYWLGKYSSDRHRPILAVMSRSHDAFSILAQAKQLSNSEYSNVSIKPDLPPEARKVQSVLLKQRRDLITSGVNQQSIKISKNSLFVNGKNMVMLSVQPLCHVLLLHHLLPFLTTLL